MSIFTKKKGNLEENGFGSQRKSYVQKAVDQKKKVVAAWLQQVSKGLTQNQQKLVLVVFSLLFGGICVAILSGSFHNPGFNNTNLIIHHLHAPFPPAAGPPISDSAYYRVKRARLWLDSLRQSDTARYRLILLSRPMLLDNLVLIERIYQSQKK